MKVLDPAQHDWQQARNETMESEESEAKLEKKKTSEKLGQVMSYIHSFVAESYNMDANPLSHLRKYFPRFIWRHHKVSSVRELHEILANSDYIWLVGVKFFWDGGVVTARQIGRRKPRVLCYCVEKPNEWPHELKSLCHARFVLVKNGNTKVG